jgi:hypothetical protein
MMIQFSGNSEMRKKAANPQKKFKFFNMGVNLRKIKQLDLKLFLFFFRKV